MVVTDKDGYKSVDYSRMTPVLVEAIKQQQDSLEKQQKLLNSNKLKISALEEQQKLLKEQMLQLQKEMEELKKKK